MTRQDRSVSSYTAQHWERKQPFKGLQTTYSLSNWVIVKPGEAGPPLLQPLLQAVGGAEEAKKDPSGPVKQGLPVLGKRGEGSGRNRPSQNRVF